MPPSVIKPSPATSVITEVVDKYADDLVALRRDLHAHPELSWEETRTSDAVATALEGAGWAITRPDGGGVLAEIGHGGRLVALRAELDARGEYVFCDEIDLCDTDFYERSLALLEAREADLVVGSKLLDGASDERPVLRHVGSIVINGMLRVALGFTGTDTHGLKAFRRSVVAPVAERCIVDKDLFASELVIRAEREGVSIVEIPVRVKEKRDPSIGLFRRVPNVLKNLAKLVVAIRIKG